MRWMFILAWALVVPLCNLTGQEASSIDARRLLERIERMEKEAELRDKKIGDLEESLKEARASTTATSDLETLVNNVVASAESNTVTAPKSSIIKISGQLRFRGEHRTVKAYDAARVDDDVDFVLQRSRVSFDASVIEDVRVFVTLQDSRMWGDEGIPTGDLEGVDVHEAWVEFSNAFGQPWTFKVGRQEISFGDQRLVSPLDWDAVTRSFDGVRTWWKEDDWSLNLFVFTIDENSVPVGGHTDDDRVFDGAYFSYTGFENHTIDAYLMHQAYSDGSFTSEDGSTGDMERVTLGFLFKGSTDGFSYSAEADYQFGDVAEDDLSAYGWALTFGYTFDHDWKPTVGIEWDFASGDDDPTDGDAETFDPIFPFGHYYQGFLDTFAWKNGHDFAFRASVKPDEDYWIEAAFHYFVLDSDRDAWYNAGSNVIRRFAAGGVGNDVGYEIDLHCKYQLNPSTALWFGYSHFFTGSYVDDTGDDPDMDWLWFQMTVSF